MYFTQNEMSQHCLSAISYYSLRNSPMTNRRHQLNRARSETIHVLRFSLQSFVYFMRSRIPTKMFQFPRFICFRFRNQKYLRSRADSSAASAYYMPVFFDLSIGNLEWNPSDRLDCSRKTMQGPSAQKHFLN